MTIQKLQLNFGNLSCWALYDPPGHTGFTKHEHISQGYGKELSITSINRKDVKSMHPFNNCFTRQRVTLEIIVSRVKR